MVSTRKQSKKQERSVAKKLGGYTVANSGATLFSDGDVTIGKHFLIECKTTMTPKQSFSIKKAWLTKIAKEKFAMGKEDYALVFSFEPNGTNYYVISEDTFKQYIKFLEESDEGCCR